MRKKIIGFIFFILILVLIIFNSFVKKNEEVKKVKGDVFANPHQLGQFIMYGNEDNKFSYYIPVEGTKNIQEIASNLYNKVNFMPIKDKNIFDYDNNEIFVVEHKDKTKDETYQHVQIQYHNDGGRFIILSAYEVSDFDDNFKILKEQYTKQGKDLFENEVEIFKIKDNMSCIHFKRTTNESLTYMYYQYDEEEDSVTLVCTAGDEVLTYKEGILYHVAFNVEMNDDVLVQMLNTFIKQ